MPNLDAIYRVIHHPSGHVVDTYDSEASALARVERENDEYPDSHVVVKYVRSDLTQQPRAPAVPAGYALVPVTELSAALDAVGGVMQDAYHRGHLVCCGKGYSGCCGNTIPEWEPTDEAIMNGLQPVHATLLSMLAAANKENNND